MGKAWSSEEREVKSPHIVALIERFNRVGRWVTGEITRHKDRKNRVKALKKFVALLTELRELQNFNSMRCIVAGISAAAVKRLSKTWGKVDKGTVNLFKEYKALFSQRKNYRVYRELLSTVRVVPC